MRVFTRTIAAGVAAAALVATTACGASPSDPPTTDGPLVVEGAKPSGQAAPDAGSAGAVSNPGSSASPSAGAGAESSGKGVSSNLSASQVTTAASELETLQVKPKGDMSGYQNKRKELFGDWSSGDKANNVAMAGNGCDTRNDILARDLDNVKKDGKCTVVAGRLWDPYGTEKNPYDHYIDFKRGAKTSSAVQIDHIVALGNVWASGGDKLSPEDRLRVANDPINLIAVDGPENGKKQDKDASEWLPHNDKLHCLYAASQIRVKAKYHLTVTPAEKDTLSKLITQCRV